MSGVLDEPESMGFNGQSQRMAEYADQLRSWLGDAYQWQALQCLPYSMPPVFIQSRYRPLQSTEAAARPVALVPNQQPRRQPNVAGPVPAEAPVEGM